jgi:hypothetical protein
MESAELRTVLNGEVLSRFSEVGEAMEHVEAFVSDHLEMFGGNLMMADENNVSITEYIDGKSRSEVVSEGYVARANHSVFGMSDNAENGSIARYTEMNGFLRDICSEIPDMNCDEVIARCRDLLRRPPILNTFTRSSFTICIEEGRVDYVVGEGPWKVFQF